MTPAVPWAPFARWFGRQATRRLRATFAGVHVRGLEHLDASRSSVLVIANHTAWWDALLALWLGITQRPGTTTYGLMDGRNLARLRFFRWLGGFGVDRSSRRDGAEAARYALSLLQGRGNLVWVFPQGAERPPHVPLRFEPGAAGIARRAATVPVVPVAFSYVFGEDERPHAYISVGAPLSAQARADRDAQALAVNDERQRIAAHLEQPDAGFVTLVRARPAGAWATAWLDRFAGWLAPRQLRRRPMLPPADLERAQAPSRVET